MDEEGIIEPKLSICDPHHHLYDWPDIPLGLPNHYLLPDFLDEIRTSGHNVRSSVFVECTAFYRASGPQE